MIADDVQDTVIALQALAEFASLTIAGDGSGAVQLVAAYGDETYSFAPITRENALLLQSVQVNSSAIYIP